MGLSDSERISMIRSAVLIQYTRVTDGQTDGRTDGQTELAWHIRAIAYMLSRVKSRLVAQGCAFINHQYPDICKFFAFCYIAVIALLFIDSAM